MKKGYSKPLYLLPFDHRQSYVTGMFKFNTPLTAQQHDEVADSKRLIYEGFQQALSQNVLVDYAAILIDEEFGSDILRDAAKRGYTTALSVEKSGSDEFDFEYGKNYARHLEEFNPAFAKILVRYNPEGDAQLNRRQLDRMQQLSNYCNSVGQLFMLELLVPATSLQLERLGNSKDAYDTQLRPELMEQAIQTFQDNGIEPDVWKIEGLDSQDDCERVVRAVQRNERTNVGCIVLGRGADEAKVKSWLTTAAATPDYIGLAVGRTTFWDAVADYKANKITRSEAGARIAKRYGEWVRIFQMAKKPPPPTAIAK